MTNIKITKYLGINPDNNKAQYVIEVPTDYDYKYNPSIDEVKIAHDYVEFRGSVIIGMTQDSKTGNFPHIPKGVKGFGSNNLCIEGSLQFDIRSMIDIVLPYLNSHKYLQQEHLKDRIHTEDDRYYTQHNLIKPRWVKGDPYPAYAYSAAIIKMGGIFHLRRKESIQVDQMSIDTFNRVKNSLELSKSSYE